MEREESRTIDPDTTTARVTSRLRSHERVVYYLFSSKTMGNGKLMLPLLTVPLKGPSMRNDVANSSCVSFKDITHSGCYDVESRHYLRSMYTSMRHYTFRSSQNL